MEEIQLKNKRIDDIFHRINANLPIPGGIGDSGCREKLLAEWIILEKRISDYYLDKRILNKELTKYEKSKDLKNDRDIII